MAGAGDVHHGREGDNARSVRAEASWACQLALLCVARWTDCPQGVRDAVVKSPDGWNRACCRWAMPGTPDGGCQWAWCFFQQAPQRRAHSRLEAMAMAPVKASRSASTRTTPPTNGSPWQNTTASRAAPRWPLEPADPGQIGKAYPTVPMASSPSTAGAAGRIGQQMREQGSASELSPDRFQARAILERGRRRLRRVRCCRSPRPAGAADQQRCPAGWHRQRELSVSRARHR